MSLLSNLIVGNQSFVLFLDTLGIEKRSTQILTNLLTSQNETNIVTNVIPETELILSLDKQLIPEPIIPTTKSIVILPPASRLFQQFYASEVFKLIHKLKNSPNVKQVFLWLSFPHFPENDHLPGFVQHMADISVRLQSKTELDLLIRKSTGSVTRKQYQYEIKDHFLVHEIQKKREEPEADAQKVKPESLGTFKIELSEKDRIARNNLVLPFEKHLNLNASEGPEKTGFSAGGKIIYDLDKDDDFDEEDPDDDLDI